MNPKLTDFTIIELNTALTAFCSYQADLTNKIELAEKYDIECSAHKQELDRVQLWVTQLISAKARLMTEEIINSN